MQQLQEKPMLSKGAMRIIYVLLGIEGGIGLIVVAALWWVRH